MFYYYKLNSSKIFKEKEECLYMAAKSECTLYDVLGIGEWTSPFLIEEAYERQTREKLSPTRKILLDTAYKVLSDSSQRRYYDSRLRFLREHKHSTDYMEEGNLSVPTYVRNNPGVLVYHHRVIGETPATVARIEDLEALLEKSMKRTEPGCPLAAILGVATIIGIPTLLAYWLILQDIQ